MFKIPSYPINRRTLLLVLILLAVITLYYFTLPDKLQQTARIIPKPNIIPKAEQQSTPIMPNGYEPNKKLRDPFLNPNSVANKSTPNAKTALGYGPKSSALSTPVLKGIVQTNNASAAILEYNGTSHYYRRHDNIGPYSLTSIGSNFVTLSGPQGQQVLSIRR